MANRKFTDNAGYTRHCWECRNSFDWEGTVGHCIKRAIIVRKYDSPNNPNSRISGCLGYDNGSEKPIERTCDNCANRGEICLGCSRHYPDLHETEEEWEARKSE